MMFQDLVLRNRSYRRFHQDQPVGESTLRELVELARLTPSAANLQPLRYVLSHTPERNAQVFNTLAWAGYLKEWPGPEEGERPTAYVIILADKSVTQEVHHDHGIAAVTILLGATEKGLGGCMFGSIRRPELLDVIGLSAEDYSVLLVVALGKPKEIVKIEHLESEGDVRYWRSEDRVHHVPKRALDDIILTWTGNAK